MEDYQCQCFIFQERSEYFQKKPYFYPHFVDKHFTPPPQSSDPLGHIDIDHYWLGFK
jgi:hypothetical protein